MKQTPLSGRYELEEIIGTGGMSVVYRAWDLKFDREVAVKVLKPEYAEDEEFIRRFSTEAQAVSQMSHPNIVCMYDVGQDGDTRYIVMEYIRGQTLKDLIRKQGTIEQKQAIYIATRILSAMEHAHKHRIIHRDIKPQNILIDENGDVKVTDFGIARMVNSQSNTKGNAMGSVHYFSPEQANGESVDSKSDLYSVGVVLFEMLTGEVPFEGETAVAIGIKHIKEQPRLPSELNNVVSKGLDEVVMKALEKDTSKRYQTAMEFAVDLRRALKMPMGGFVRKTAEEIRAEQIRRLKKKWTARLAIAAFVAVVLGVFVSGWRLYERMQTRVSVPGVLMDDAEDAAAQMEALGLVTEITESYHDQVIAGIVFEQMPAEGTLLYPGDRVYLSVSRGKESVQVPLLEGAGLTRSEAEQQLTDAGLMAGQIVLIISDEKVGTVVGQEPSAGEMVKPFSEVTLYVSGETASIPLLKGLTVELARSTLAASGFQLGETREKLDEAEAGTVISQSIEAGETALVGEHVNVVVSQAIPESYFAATSVVVTVEEDGDEILCMLTGGSGITREVYRDAAEPGNQTINLNLDSHEPGEHVLSVYVQDELAVEKTIVFEKKQTQE